MANQQLSVNFLEMNCLGLNPAVNRALGDARDLGGSLWSHHFDPTAAGSTPHQSGVLICNAAEHDAFFGFDSHFSCPYNSFHPSKPLQDNSKSAQETDSNVGCKRQSFLLESAPSDWAELAAPVPERHFIHQENLGVLSYGGIFSEGPMNPAIGHKDKHLYVFGDFCLDPVERVLVRDGERVSLAPKAFDTLLLILHH